MTLDKRPDRIQGLFGRIAPWYDLCNHLLTLGIDRRWRRRLARDIGLPAGSRVLDVACGTGDLAAEMRRHGYRVAGADFCRPMLERCRLKGLFPVLQADALRLPIRDASLDGATVAFGVRNFADPSAGIRELRRVLRPGGVLAILEFGVPRPWGLRHAYLAYFRYALPLIGRIVSGDAAAYAYLRDSVMAFPHGPAFERMLEDAGLDSIASAPLSLGIVHLYLARRPAAEVS